MMDFFNIHTHKPTHPEAEILSLSATDMPFFCERTVYASVGIHPWKLTEENAYSQWKSLQENLSNPSVIAIGEAGLDKCKGSSMNLQMTLFKRQATLSEEKSLPLIIHCVKSFNELVQLKKEIHPSQPWIIHGFRGKEALAMDCIRHGFYLSFGEHFQESALRTVPIERLFIETDESGLPIGTIYRSIANTRGISLEELNESIKKNVREVFFKG